MRKALVNDVVASFIWCLQHRHQWPSPLMEQLVPPWAPIQEDDDRSVLAYFSAYAVKKQANLVFAQGAIMALAPWLRCFSPQERDYAKQLLETYYVPRLSDRATVGN